MGIRKPGKLLRDYRWVYSHDKQSDDTPGRKTLRKLLGKNEHQFLAQMAKLEEAMVREEKADAPPPSPGEAAAGDVGTGKALELIDKLLGEWDTSRGNGMGNGEGKSPGS